MNQLLLGTIHCFQKIQSSINCKYERAGHLRSVFLVEKLSVPAELPQDRHRSGPTHTDPGQRDWRAEGLRSGGAGAGGLTARPGRVWAMDSPGGMLPSCPTLGPPTAARAQVQADGLPETHPGTLPRPCTWSPPRGGSPALPSGPSSSHRLLDPLGALLGPSRVQPSLPPAAGEAREGGRATEEPGRDAWDVHVSSLSCRLFKNGRGD